MMSPTAARPAWVVPTLVVAIFAVAVFAVLAFGQVRGQPPFPTQAVPLPTASAATEAPARVDYGLTLTATGLGPHQFGTAGNAVLESLIQTLGPPTEDAPEECDSGQEPRLVRWADLSIRIESGQFVAFVEGIYYPPGPPPLALPTAEGLAPGDPATRLFELYEPASLRQVPGPAPSEQEVMQFEIAAAGATTTRRGRRGDGRHRHCRRHLGRELLFLTLRTRDDPLVQTTSGSVSSRRGLGISAGLDVSLARDLAINCAQLGYDSLWSNDEPSAPGLETLAQFAAAAPGLELGVGVLPLDRYEPSRVAAEIDRLGLDTGKLWLGIGAGQMTSPIDIVRRAVAALHELLPEHTRIVIAAMRPGLCRLGGEIADGVLLNWMLPQQAAQARQWVWEGAADAGRDAPVVASYIRVAVGPDSSERLRDEENRYRNINENHRQHFEVMNVPVGSVGVAAMTRPEVLDGLAPYHAAIDLPIARVLAQRDARSLIAAAVAAAP